jgi:diguanylate cyclase (GGDEF)-like protein
MHIHDGCMSWTLEFKNESLEEQFVNEVVLNNPFVPRIVYLGGSFLYAIFFVLDLFFLKNILLYSIVIRFFIVCPMLFGTYFLIGTAFYRKHWKKIDFLNGFFAGMGLVLLISASQIPASHLYYGGLLLCCLFYYVFKPNQIRSNVLSWGIFAAYLITTIFFTKVPEEIVLNNVFIFFFFNIGAMFACYAMELSQRREFINRCTIQDQSDRLYKALSDVDQQREKAERLSLLDPLTGLPNRRHFFSILQRELECSIKGRRDMGLMLVDIDYFKEVNDRFGHVYGDQILALVAEIIADSVRKCDTPCRYGGEEFAILLPGAAGSIVEKIGRRLMDRIGSANVLGKEEGAGLTVSIGFVSLRNEEKVSVEDLIRRADQALYEAKRTGRNQLRMWASQGADRLV